jgi:hypothetical protein
MGAPYDATGVGLCDLDEAFHRLRMTRFHAAESRYQYFIKLKRRDKAPSLFL